jgi:hypothetical protein
VDGDIHGTMKPELLAKEEAIEKKWNKKWNKPQPKQVAGYLDPKNFVDGDVTGGKLKPELAAQDEAMMKEYGWKN